MIMTTVCSVAQFYLTFCDPMDCSLQAPLSKGFIKQKYWSRLPFPPPGDLPDPGIETTSLVSSALAGGFFTTVPPGKSDRGNYQTINFLKQRSSVCLIKAMT